MRSTFSGLEIARSTLTASQIALNVIGQNIANEHTENYTRQRADQIALNYSSGIYKFAIPPRVNTGQGVDISQISQVRDSFIDARLRTANAEYNSWGTKLNALEDIEIVFDETENDGLHAMLDEFYNQLQALSNHVGDVEYTSILRSAAEKVTQVLHQYASQLKQIRLEQQEGLGIDVSAANTLVDKINEVNQLIKDQTLRGNISNELLDLRNAYLDQLSGYLEINVIPQEDGTVKVSSSGGLNILENKLSIVEDAGTIKIFAHDGGADPAIEFSPKFGTLRGHLDVLNGSGAVAGEFRGLPYYENALNDFAMAFAGTFNDLNTLDPLNPMPLFGSTDGEAINAANITISAQWLDNSDFIVNTSTGNSGANDNIIRMINAMDNPVNASLYPGIDSTFSGFSRILMSTIAVDVGYQIDISKMTGSILDSVANQRESISGVSLNEETINMTKYEKSFQAAARLMTAMDEALDIIINRMGIVGR